MNRAAMITTAARTAGTILFQGSSFALSTAAILVLFCAGSSKTVSIILVVEPGDGLGAGGGAAALTGGAAAEAASGVRFGSGAKSFSSSVRVSTGSLAGAGAEAALASDAAAGGAVKIVWSVGHVEIRSGYLR